MLTHLEISGFKSFPDRTRLEFAPGITGIVGPNGSGKSNIVDAIRWVLGEQSAKSLRGDGMADVLFKGSASRRSVQVAEVTLVLDNQAGHLAAELSEIRVTRRLSRQGQSEYLVNGSTCRLKDIKDLFLGSGAGSDSFCVIQQGQVHALLQASPVERRALFEEAAGVSRYKASREESRRKLDRVDSHLGRLADLKEELDRRVQSARLQAAKAEKWREVQNQIKEARIDLMAHHWREGQIAHVGLKARLAAIDSETVSDAPSHISEALGTLQDRVVKDESVLRESERAEAVLVQGIATARSQIEREFHVMDASARERARTLDRVLRAHNRLAAGRLALGNEDQLLNEIGIEINRLTLRSAAQEIEGQRCKQALNQFRSLQEAAQHENTNCVRELALLEKQWSAAQIETERNRTIVRQARLVAHRASEGLNEVNLVLADLNVNLEGARNRLEGARAGWRAEVEARDGFQAAVDHLAKQAQTLLLEKKGLGGRREVLEGLERSHEGFGAGVRDVLALWQADPAGPWRCVQGLLADHLKVRREYAPLLELALGERSQRILALDRSHVRAALGSISKPLDGRAGFLFPADEDDEDDDAFIPPPVHTGIIARAANLARCDHPRFADLPERLLGRVLIVRDLEAAFELLPVSCGYSLVTLKGEWLDADGGLSCGPLIVEAGVLSRKAELREVRERLAQIEGAWREMERESATQAAMLRAAQERVGTLQQRIDQLAEKEQALSRQVDDHVSRLKGLETEAETGAREEQEALARLAHLVTESVVLESEKKKMAIRVSESADQASLQAIQLDQALEDVRQADRLLFETQTQLAEKQVVLSQVQMRRRTRIDEVRALVAEVDREESDARVEAIRSEKHHRALLEQLASLPDYYNSLLYAQELLSEAKIKHDESRRILVEAVHAQSDQAESRDQKSQQRQALELESARILMQLDELKRRAFDDYQFDLETDISNRAVPSHLDTDGAKIEDLRRQAQRLGTVNEEAVHELQELTERQRAFHDQMQDLQAARKGLLDLIDAANAEGSTRFLTVFHAVAGHFRDLFRKLFGGGQAELSLVDPANPLDCGIEVIAKPPGKDAASLSLMSGGERTMTAVALLLAVFRSCPSPFCVLDEVDAALDEANVGRFTDLLKEFSERTQFILITHHKRTMACADVLLGITMSEPGVSTRMAVKLDDWLGNGGAKVAA